MVNAVAVTLTWKETVACNDFHASARLVLQRVNPASGSVYCQPRTEPQPRAMTLRPVYLSICLSASLVVWLSFVWSVCSVCFLRVHMCSKPSAVTHSSSRPQRQRASWQSSWSADFDAMSLLIIIYSTGLTLTASLCSVPLQVKAAITKILLKLNLTVSVWIT